MRLSSLQNMAQSEKQISFFEKYLPHFRQIKHVIMKIRTSLKMLELKLSKKYDNLGEV